MPRSHHCLAIVGSSMYIFGGLSEEAKLLCDLHVFDLEKLVWRALHPEGTGPCGRINHSAHILGNFFVVFGGYDGKLRLNDIFLLDLDNGCWTAPLIHGTPPSRRLGHASVVTGDKFIVFGGDDGNKERELLNDLYILDLPSMRWYAPELGGCAPPQGRTHATLCTTTEEHLWLIDGSNSHKEKLDEIYRLDLSSLYIFQKMWIDRASTAILRDLTAAYQQIQVRANISSHFASKRSPVPPSKRRAVPGISSPSSSIAPSSSSTILHPIPVGPDAPLLTNQPYSASSPVMSFSPSDDDPSPLTLTPDVASNPKKPRKKMVDRSAEKDLKESSKDRLSASVGIPIPPSSSSSTEHFSSDDRNARSPKRRRNKTIARSASAKRDTSPPLSPPELSPATSPRYLDAVLNQVVEEEEKFDGSGHLVTFADQASPTPFEEDPESRVVARVRKTLNDIKESFHQLSIDKEGFLRGRQERLAMIAEAGNRDTTQGLELQRLIQQQKSRVILNVGGSLFATSIITLTKYPDSMLATMFSGRHTLIPEADGTYFIDRDGTYFRYILNYLRYGEDIVLEAKPSVLTEILAEARFYQLEGLKDAIQVILSDPALDDEPIVEY